MKTWDISDISHFNPLCCQKDYTRLVLTKGGQSAGKSAVLRSQDRFALEKCGIRIGSPCILEQLDLNPTIPHLIFTTETQDTPF